MVTADRAAAGFSWAIAVRHAAAKAAKSKVALAIPHTRSNFFGKLATIHLNLLNGMALDGGTL
jgi:hypothetical protein